jgi:hypothetical protein
MSIDIPVEGRVMREKLREILNQLMALEILENYKPTLLAGEQHDRFLIKNELLRSAFEILDKFKLDKPDQDIKHRE